MADTKISNLSAVTSLTGTDELVLAKAGTTKKIDALYLPGFEIAYAEFTSNVTVNATSEASPNDVVSSGAVTYAATRICVEFWCWRAEVGTSSGSFTVCNLWDASTDLGRMTIIGHPSGSEDIHATLMGRRFLTPTAASHTYRIRAWRVNSDGLLEAGAGGTGTALPGYIRVTAA